MSKQLKPCPFCGFAAEVFSRGFGMAYVVNCINMTCAAEGPEKTKRETAVRAWNRRAGSKGGKK